MAKPLVFEYGGRNLSFSMSKVDRSKLYGFKRVEVLDEEERPCELATLADDGRTIIGRGGIGTGYVSSDGRWCDKDILRPVDLEGNQIQPVPSSFAAPLPLAQRVSTDEYLQHDVRSVYLMQTEDDAGDLVEELRQGAIFKFPYSFRGGLQADAGFLLANVQGEVFMAVGNPAGIEFVGLHETAPVVEEEEGAEQEPDLMDFDMI